MNIFKRYYRLAIFPFLSKEWVKFAVPVLIFIMSASANAVEAESFHQEVSSVNTIDTATRTFILGEIDQFTPIIEERRDIDRINILEEGDDFVIRKPTLVDTEVDEPEVAPNAPRTQTITHVVQAGETLSEIGEMYGLKLKTLLAANQNLASADDLALGDKLIIPFQNYDPTYADKLLAKKNAKLNRGSIAKSSTGSTLSKSSGYSQTVSGGNCVKPVGYTYVSRRLQSGHFGIDMIAPTGTPIYASCSGKIMDLAGGWSGGFGLHVKIAQDNGDTSVYGHMSSISKDISPGQYVPAGTYLGQVGSTGRSTGSHLHFELGCAGRAVDSGFSNI